MLCLPCARSCQENTSLGRCVCRRLAPRPCAASLCPAAPFKMSARAGSISPTRQTHARDQTHARVPRQDTQTKAARSLARSPELSETSRAALAGQLWACVGINHLGLPANQSHKSIGANIVWDSGQRGGWHHYTQTVTMLVYLILCRVLLFLCRFAGNIGAELSYSNVGMFISSDAGNSWRQVSHTGAQLLLE